MTRHPTPDLHHPMDLDRLREEALIEAEALRHQAIDDLWRGAGEVLATAATRALRASARWRAALRRHAPAPELG